MFRIELTTNRGGKSELLAESMFRHGDLIARVLLYASLCPWPVFTLLSWLAIYAV